MGESRRGVMEEEGWRARAGGDCPKGSRAQRGVLERLRRGTGQRRTNGKTGEAALRALTEERGRLLRPRGGGVIARPT